MKLTKIPLFFLFVLLLIIFSCVKKQNENISQDSLLSHIPMPAKLDSAMRITFDTVTFKILKGINPKNIKSFMVKKDNYIKMIDDFPANANRVAFSFVQFNKSKFPNKYQELTKYDGCLYLVHYYMDVNGNNVGNKVYAMLGTQNIIEITNADYQVMVNDYIANIKSKINTVVKGKQGNTMRVKFNKDELQEYKNRVLSKTNIRNFKITLAQWVNYNNYLTRNELDAFTSRLAKFTEDNTGQMTFITDCQDNNGNNVDNLSGFDLQSFCPTDCP